MSHCKRHKSFPLLGRLKTVLQLLNLSLNSNDPLFHLAPGSLVHHRHLSCEGKEVGRDDGVVDGDSDEDEESKDDGG